MRGDEFQSDLRKILSFDYITDGTWVGGKFRRLNSSYDDVMFAVD